MKPLIHLQPRFSKVFNFVFGILIVISIFTGLRPYLHFPLTDNEGIFSYIGQALLNGSKLYQDIWDHKPPFLFIHFLFLQKIGGNEEVLLHTYAALIHCINALLLFWLGKRWLGHQSWWCSITYVVLILPPLFQCWTPQAELLMEPFLLGALLLISRKRAWRWLLAGALAACGFFTKQSFILYLPLFFLEKNFLGFFEFFYFFVGLDTAGLLVVSPFLLDGRLNQLWYATWGFNRFYVENGWIRFLHHPEFRSGLVLWLIKTAEVYGFFLLASFYFMFSSVCQWANKKYSKESFFLVYWFLSSLAMIISSGYFFPYYSVVLILPLSVLTPMFLIKLRKNQSFFGWLLIALLAVGPLASWITVIHSGTDALAWSGYLKDHDEAAKEMGDYLKTIAKPGDKLLAWSMEPQIYVYSGLSAVSYLKTPLVNHLLVMPEELSKARENFFSDPPRFVVVSRYDQVNDPPDWLMTELNEKRRLLHSTGKLQLFTLKADNN